MIRYSQIDNRESFQIAPEEFESELLINITSGNAKNTKQIIDSTAIRFLE